MTRASLLPLVVLALAAAGCASLEGDVQRFSERVRTLWDSEIDAHWGESTRASRQGMIANPEAGERVQEVVGLGATTASDVTQVYHEQQLEAAEIDERETILLIPDSD